MPAVCTGMAHHRKMTASMQVSLDGLAERPSGATDWIGTNPDTFDWELLERIDACVLAPPRSSFVTSSWVTALMTSGPVMNM